MDKKQLEIDIREMLADQFYHQADKPFLEIDRDYLVELIIKQMEHAYHLAEEKIKGELSQSA